MRVWHDQTFYYNNPVLFQLTVTENILLNDGIKKNSITIDENCKVLVGRTYRLAGPRETINLNNTLFIFSLLQIYKYVRVQCL